MAAQYSLFEQNVEKALKDVERILNWNKTAARVAGMSDHEYDDKFSLADLLTNMMIATHAQTFKYVFGQTFEQQSPDRPPITLRFVVQEKCELHSQNTITVSNTPKTTITQETTTSAGASSSPNQSGTVKTETTVVQSTINIQEFHWNVSTQHRILAYGRHPDDNPVVLHEGMSTKILITTAPATSADSRKPPPPLPALRVRDPIDINITWLARNVSGFAIDRENAKTPRRNEQIKKAIEFVKDFSAWCKSCYNCLKSTAAGWNLHSTLTAFFKQYNPQQLVHVGALSSQYHAREMDLFRQLVSEYNVTFPQQWEQSVWNVPHIFIPILPVLYDNEHLKLLQNSQGGEQTARAPLSPTHQTSSTTSSIQVGPVNLTSKPPLLSATDLGLLYQEHARSLNEAWDTMKQTTAANPEHALSIPQSQLLLLWKHCSSVNESWQQAIEYIEEMLRNQLYNAIGKTVTNHDLDDYMRYRYPRLFKTKYHPKPFSHVLRKSPTHAPEGTLSIEYQNVNDSSKEFRPIETFCRYMNDQNDKNNTSIDGEDISMFIPISSASSVEFCGDYYLHTWLQPHFANSYYPNYYITAQARQFSSFVLVLGNIAGPSKFQPKHAIVVQNKDQVWIPLLLKTLPSAQEFRDAIRSLSPQQQEFCRAMRSMQLDTSVFAICTIPIKPQLELVLGLPTNSLTREIELTQDLMELLLEYQIPSDILSNDDNLINSGEINANNSDKKSSTVQDQINAIHNNVDRVKKVIQKTKDQIIKAKEEKDKALHGTTPQSQGGLFGSPSPSQTSPFGSRQASFFGAPPPAPAAAPPAGGFGMAANAATVGSANNEATTTPQPKPSEANQSDTLLEQMGNLELGSLEELEEWASSSLIDYTTIPKLLDQKFEQYDTEKSLRTTIIETKEKWTRRSQENILTKMEKSTLHASEQKSEKSKAFDLLDVLSKSGKLPFTCGEMHIIVGVTHSFNDSLIETVIQENINPIQKLERSALLVTSFVHGSDAASMCNDPKPSWLQDNTF